MNSLTHQLSLLLLKGLYRRKCYRWQSDDMMTAPRLGFFNNGLKVTHFKLANRI